MDILISNASPDPIYLQITKQIKEAIMKGEITAGEQLPSIRKLAQELQISVITTKRAYSELENEGFIVTVGGKGSFVAEQNRALMWEKKMRLIEEKLIEVIKESRMLDIPEEELHKMLSLLYEEVQL